MQKLPKSFKKWCDSTTSDFFSIHHLVINKPQIDKEVLFDILINFMDTTSLALNYFDKHSEWNLKWSDDD